MVMKRNLLKRIFMAGVVSSALVLGGCSAEDVKETLSSPVSESEVSSEEVKTAGEELPEESLSSASEAGSTSSLIDTASLFTDRDIAQEADLSDATYITLTSGEDVQITSEGVYVISGTASDTTIIVDTDDASKVQMVLDGVSVTNSDFPAIYVKQADKVFVTTTDSENTLKVTGSFKADGTTNTDAVIFSKDDLVINGVGTLTISSTENGISGKDDVKLTGGTLNISSAEDAVEANDSIAVYGGTFNITSQKDAFHAENDDDNTLGYVYIKDGVFSIDAGDDGIQATTVLVIDGGAFDITAEEGLEATYVQINGGTISISASDDGINAAQKSTAFEVVIEINGGSITIVMGSGDTDAIDANGYIYVNGGTIDITANSAFDYDKGAELNGGTVTVNGETITQITNSMMGGGMRGGMGQQGQMPQGDSGQIPGQQQGQAPNQNSSQQGFGQGGMPQGQRGGRK